MNKLFIRIASLTVVLISVFFVFNSYIYNEKQGVVYDGYKNAEYLVEGMRLRLIDGVAETFAAEDSETKIVTRYFGNELKRDLNGDQREDVVFFLTQETGGSGTFYYVVAALSTERGYVGSEAFFVGDRIAPQTIEKGNGNIIIVNYAERAPGEDFSVQPSVGKSMWILLDPATLQFGHVEKDFEGEADPARLNLQMKTWKWVNALYGDGREIVPKNPDAFTITFSNDGTFSASTDCNGLGGDYTDKKNLLTFGPIVSTQMFCEGSQESEFGQLIQNTSSYHFSSKGELIFDLKFDSGSVVFR